ncbi:MAG TPA: DegV family protein [Gemmatimonadota bacterium]|nr:DegV family protein [Gemmatimonadota bacterium]
MNGPRTALVTDTTAAIESLAPGSSWTVVPLELEIDGRTYREGPELSAGEFHQLLQHANAPPVTLPPSIDAFVETFEGLLEGAERVLAVHLSGELSQTVEHARAAARRVDGEGRVRVVDSRLAGAATGLLCLEAEARLAAGEGVDEVAAALESLVERSLVYFSVYTLDYLYLGGRLERMPRTGAATEADRPILTMRDGRLALVERVIGETTRVERMAELVEERFGREEPLGAVCVHAGPQGQEAARMLEERVRSAPRGNATLWRRAPLGPVLCAHTGFDVCGVAAYPRAASRLVG